MEKSENTKLKFSNDKSDEYRTKIHDLIPGGAHTYSKGKDTFPENVPEFINSGKGAYVCDDKGKKYIDMAMGLSAVTIGHGINEIDNLVIETIRKGLNFQRPSYLELKFAKAFLKLIPQHDMVKFAKNGSTVTTAATKLARAYTGRELIAFPSQHPFFSYDDWFIGKTKCNYGIPNSISDLSITFNACNLDSLIKLFEDNPDKIACVIMEPVKFSCFGCNCNIHFSEYLKKAIEIVRQNGAVFILDEMITCYKADFPGITSKYDLNPDITTWGKSISNGYSFSCMTGKKDIMELGSVDRIGKKKFFLTSTTHGAETIGLRAALETLNFYKKHEVIKHIHRLGEILIEKIKPIIEKNKLEKYIIIKPCPWFIALEFHDKDEKASLKFKTLFSQEMIKSGILIQSSIVLSFSHTQKEIDCFLKSFKDFLIVYKRALDGRIEDFVQGSFIKPVFREFN